MATETGHAKNLANIDKLIDYLTQLGAVYNPTNTQITIAALKALNIKCNADYNNWVTKFTAYKSETNNREIAFAPLSKLCTTISDNVKTLDVPSQTIDDVSALVSKIHGNSKLTKADAGIVINPPNSIPPPNDNTGSISTVQQSFDSISANFEKLVLQVKAIASYSPNETNIQAVNLQALLTNLNTVNQNAITATNALSIARNQRNQTFYEENTGLCDITKKTKLYVRQLFGTQSPEYRQVASIKFVKVVPKKKV